MIPNTIHFLFGLQPDFGGKPFSFVHWLAVRAAKAVNPGCTLVLHYAFEPEGPWWNRARSHLILEKVSPPETIFGNRLAHFAHKADVLRLEILRKHGGIYIDMDVICLKPFCGMMEYSTVMGIEPNSGLCNAVILAEPHAPFLELWYETYRMFDAELWNYHSVMLPYALALKRPDLIHVASERAFFFPSFDNPLRGFLWEGRVPLRDRMAGLASDLEDSLRLNPKNVPGRLRWQHHALPRRRFLNARYALRAREWLARQMEESICLHLWESMWWQRYLRDLTPQTLAQSDGLFAPLLERILPGEIRMQDAPKTASLSGYATGVKVSGR